MKLMLEKLLDKAVLKQATLGWFFIEVGMSEDQLYITILAYCIGVLVGWIITKR